MYHIPTGSAKDFVTCQDIMTLRVGADALPAIRLVLHFSCLSLPSAEVAISFLLLSFLLPFPVEFLFPE